MTELNLKVKSKKTPYENLKNNSWPLRRKKKFRFDTKKMFNPKML